MEPIHSTLASQIYFYDCYYHASLMRWEAFLMQKTWPGSQFWSPKSTPSKETQEAGFLCVCLQVDQREYTFILEGI